MTPERWAEIEELFYHAAECGVGEREGLLQDAGNRDPELRREVEALLSSHESAPGRLWAAVRQEVRALSDAECQDSVVGGAGLGPGSVIGPYHLVHLIGEGGMGEVWLAEQKQPVRRRVAVKLIKTGMDTREVAARFESERQALALMDHPAIAKVFDAGSTPEGRPYFVMEYVPGIPVTGYCDKHKLTTRQRLELFILVCEGVQHAHQKAIIHRDLKASNILVAEVGGKPMPKIIDFGVAKATGQKLTAETLYTRVGAVIGTIGYMSPEQANSGGEDIDTRTDVYSLGVVLYELLVGALPFDFRKAPFDEALRRLREQDPPKPSTKLRTQGGEESTSTAQNRSTDLPALIRLVRGDADAIALKALEKDRARRYATPLQLAGDIGRYLRNEPVTAHAPSIGYHARKFARRHFVALVTAGAFLLVLIVAAGVSIRQSIRANREAAMAQAVNDFLQNDLLAQASAASQSGPSSKPDPHLEVRTALDRAAAQVAGKFDRQPEVEAAIRNTIGQTYMDLGLYPKARAQLQRALELNRSALGIENPNTLETLSRLGRTALLQGKNSEAEALTRQALEGQRRVLGAEHPDTLRSMYNLGLVYLHQRKYPEAKALYSQLLEIDRRVLGADHPATLNSMHTLAILYLEEGKYPEAEALYSRLLEIERRVLGPEHPNTLNSMSNLALVYNSQGKYAQAEVLFNQTLEIKRRVLGAEHPNTLSSATGLATAYGEEGKYAQAEVLFNQTLEIQRRVLGAEHPYTLTSMNNLAEVYYWQGRYAQAEALLNQTLEIKRRVLGAEDPHTLNSTDNLAEVYYLLGRYAQAEALLNQTLGIERRVLGPEHPNTLYTLSDFALMYQRQGKYALAETYAAQTLAGRRHALGSEHPNTIASAADLALAYVSQGKFAKSEPLAREAFDFDSKKAPDDWQRFRAESLLGASLAGDKNYAKAEPLLLEGYLGMLARKARIDVPDWYHLDRAREWIVQLYASWGKPAKAAEWRKK